ncbi:KGG domain-containing protein [Mesorhizobium sp. ORM8.1]
MPNQGGNHEQHVKAGEQSHKNNDQNRQSGADQQQADQGQREGQHRGGGGNFADDREKASEAGRKGGQS